MSNLSQPTPYVTIYQAINLVNGKKYIGVTRYNLPKREGEHRRCANNGHGTLFARALRKYGDLVRFTSLKVCQNRDEAYAEERRLIRLLTPEYNSCAGGEGISGLSADAIERRAAKLRGRKRGPMPRESVEKRKATILANGSTTRYWLGKKRDKEMVLRVAATMRSNGHYAKLSALHGFSVRCLNDGLVFPSIARAASHYNVGVQAVWKVCHGKNKKLRSGLSFEFSGK